MSYLHTSGLVEGFRKLWTLWRTGELVANDDSMGQGRRLPGECEGPWTTGRDGEVCRWATWSYRGTNKYGNKYTTHALCCNEGLLKLIILKTFVINSHVSSVVTVVLAGDIPSPALLLGNTRQV